MVRACSIAVACDTCKGVSTSHAIIDSSKNHWNASFSVSRSPARVSEAAGFFGSQRALTSDHRSALAARSR